MLTVLFRCLLLSLGQLQISIFNFFSIGARNCSRCLLQSSREWKFFSIETFGKTEINDGRPKVQ